MSQLSKCFLAGDFTDWPLDQATACEICLVRFVRGPEYIVDKFAELRVRSQVVKDMANIYIQRHVQDLGDRPQVFKLHVSASSGNLAQQFRTHIEHRVNEQYPVKEFGTTEGVVPAQIRALARGPCPYEKKQPSAFDMKQPTMPDTPQSATNLFHGVRPSIVVDEATAAHTFLRTRCCRPQPPRLLLWM